MSTPSRSPLATGAAILLVFLIGGFTATVVRPATRSATGPRDLRDETFAGKTIEEIDFQQTTGSGVSFSRARFPDGASFIDANLVAADFTTAKLLRAKFDSARLTSASFLSAEMTDARLPAVSASGANFTGARLENVGANDAGFNGARFVGANLRRAQLQNTILVQADLSTACLRHANLANADLGGATLRGADLRGADLTGAHFDGATAFDGAIADSGTTWPGPVPAAVRSTSGTPCPDG